MTVFFQCSAPPFPKSLEPVQDQIVFKRDDKVFAFVERYAYCFYPNSEKADFIGYFRYDFHSDSMGKGDLGEHSYFHMHHRQVEKSFKLPTGAMIEFDKIVSAVESLLAPRDREKRLNRLFNNGQFAELLMDLTADGIKQKVDTIKNTPAWRKYEHKGKYEQFLKGYY